MIRLICIDVDGTLIGSSGKVLPEVWTAAARLRERGVRLAICSGRPAFGTTREYATQLDALGWHAFQNGASVLHLPTGSSRSARISPDIIAELIARAQRQERLLELYSDMEYAVEKDFDRARRHAQLLGIPFAVRAFASLKEPIVRAQWLLEHAQVDTVLQEPHDGLEMSPSTSPVMPDTVFVNMTPSGVSKASAVRLIAAEYGLPLASVMVVGDGENDIGAMRAVGHPVAMGNAEKAVREAASRCVDHVDDGGLVQALDLALRAN